MARADYDSSFWEFSLTTEGYGTNNINYANSSPDGDFYGVYKPRIGVRPDVAFGELSMEGGITAFTFVNHTELNKIFADSRASVSTRLGRRFQITITDRFTSQPIDFSKPSGTPANLTNVNQAGGTITYTFPLAGRHRLYLGGNFEATTLLSFPNDSYQWGASLDYERRISARLKFNLIQVFNQTRFYDQFTGFPAVPLYTLSTSSTRAQVSYRTGPRLEAQLAAGVSTTWVASKTLFSPTANGGLKWDPSSRLSLYADLGYSERVDTRGNAVRFLNAAGRYNLRMTPKVSWETSVSYSRVTVLVPLPGAVADPNASNINMETRLGYRFRKELEGRISYGYSKGFENNSFNVHSAAVGLKLTL